MALSTTKRNNQTIAQYVEKMKARADDVSSTGKKIDGDNMVSYILAGLNSDLDSIISAVSFSARRANFSL
jgi:hypothetical protein